MSAYGKQRPEYGVCESSVRVRGSSATVLYDQMECMEMEVGRITTIGAPWPHPMNHTPRATPLISSPKSWTGTPELSPKQFHQGDKVIAAGGVIRLWCGGREPPRLGDVLRLVADGDSGAAVGGHDARGGADAEGVVLGLTGPGLRVKMKIQEILKYRRFKAILWTKDRNMCSLRAHHAACRAPQGAFCSLQGAPGRIIGYSSSTGKLSIFQQISAAHLSSSPHCHPSYNL